MDFQSATKTLSALLSVLAFAAAGAQTVPVQQFGLTAVNSNGNALYNEADKKILITTG